MASRVAVARFLTNTLGVVVTDVVPDFGSPLDVMVDAPDAEPLPELYAVVKGSSVIGYFTGPYAFDDAKNRADVVGEGCIVVSLPVVHFAK